MHKELLSLVKRLHQITDDKDGDLVVIIHSSLVLFHCSRGVEGALPYDVPVVSMNIIILLKVKLKQLFLLSTSHNTFYVKLTECCKKSGKVVLNKMKFY